MLLKQNAEARIPYRRKISLDEGLGVKSYQIYS